MWVIGIRKYDIRLPWRFFARITAISVAAALAARLFADRLPAIGGLVAGSVAAIVVFFGLAFLFKVLEPEDCSRFKVLSAACPRALARPLDYFFDSFLRRVKSDSTTV
jgi:hypothetical protein